jgi:hypothetical protein
MQNRSKFKVGERVKVNKDNAPPVHGVVVATSKHMPVMRCRDGHKIEEKRPGVDVLIDGGACCVIAHDDQVTRA